MSGGVGRDVQERARELGRALVLPKTNQLLIDIDTHEAFYHFHSYIKLVQEKMPCTFETHESPSEHPGHYHITVTFEGHDLTAWERIALQCALGSDCTREVLSIIDLLNHNLHPTVFFERTDTICRHLPHDGPCIDGLMFCASCDSELKHDGAHWRKYERPKSTDF